jgi:predicted RNA-binding protein with PUA-like domain
MNYWLVKSEPSAYSFDQLVADKVTGWEGIRSYAARNHLRSMKKGDLVLFYHSNQGTEIVGIAKVAKEHYQDPTTDETAWLAVDLKAIKKLKKPVTLSEIKQNKKLKDFTLIKISRLSVMPVTDKEFETILEMSGTSV